MVKGSDVHDKLESKIKDMERRESQFNSNIVSGESRIKNLTGEREEIYVKLAVSYFDEAQARELQGMLRSVQSEVDELFSLKKQRRSEVESCLDRTSSEREQSEAQVKSITDDLNKKGEEKASKISKARAILSDSLNYSTAETEFSHADAQFNQAKKRQETLKTRAPEEIGRFDQNPLFRYLFHTQQFGTDNYSSNPLTVRMDPFVAKVINFEEQRKNYLYWLSMPEIISGETQKRHAVLQAAHQKIEFLEKTEMERQGVLDLESQMSQYLTAREEQLRQIAQLNQEEKVYHQELHEIDTSKSPYHIDVVQRLKTVLKGGEIQDLKRLARQTSGTEDDNLVARIEEIDAEVKSLKGEIKEVYDQRSAHQEKLEGLRNLENKFRNNSYDSRRSRFEDSFDIDSLLLGYIAGRVSGRDITSSMESSHYVKREESTSSYTSSSSYDFGSSSSSSSSFGSSSGFSSGSDSGFGGGGGWSSGGDSGF